MNPILSRLKIILGALSVGVWTELSHRHLAAVNISGSEIRSHGDDQEKAVHNLVMFCIRYGILTYEQAAWVLEGGDGDVPADYEYLVEGGEDYHYLGRDLDTANDCASDQARLRGVPVTLYYRRRPVARFQRATDRMLRVPL